MKPSIKYELLLLLLQLSLEENSSCSQRSKASTQEEPVTVFGQSCKS